VTGETSSGPVDLYRGGQGGGLKELIEKERQGETVLRQSKRRLDAKPTLRGNKGNILKVGGKWKTWPAYFTGEERSVATRN